MLKKIFKFRSGYVIIKVVGKNKERFVNLCLENGFDICDVKPEGDGFVLAVSDLDFMNLKHIVRESGVKIRILEKHGVRRFIRKNRRRVMLPVGAVLVVLFFAFMPKYIWCVEVEGAKNADTEKIMRILADKNVYPGAKKKDIADLGEIKNAVVFGVDGINWAWLYVDGAKARLCVSEGSAAPVLTDKTAPATIIAANDGYVRIAEVKRGERRVTAGDSVSRGDVLVSGKVSVSIEGETEKYTYVNSEARIIADTVRVETGTFSTEEILRKKTGNTKKRIAFTVFGREYFPFGKADEVYKKSDISAKNYDVSLPFVGYLGFGMSIYEACEVEEYRHKLDKDEVLSRAAERLEEKICKTLGNEAERTSEKLTYTVDGDEYTVTLRMNFRENIGIKIPQEE